jgi:hypothetical protein
MIFVMLSSFITFDSMSTLVIESSLGLVEGVCVACEELSTPIRTDLFSDVPPMVVGVDVGI